jgi:hypothetical protein
MQPSPALRRSISPAFNLEASLAGNTTMQLMTATQHGQAARLPQKKEQTQMKMRITALVALTLGLGAFTVLAQNHPGGPPGSGGFGRPPGGGRHPVMPIMTALDVNADGMLDATEVGNASAALKTLDKNSDGMLSADELMPPPPGGTDQVRPTPPPGARRPAPPIVAALDTNGDGELDATEITNASAALLQLDVNGDGSLSKEELRPKDHRGPGGPGGPGAPPEGGSSSGSGASGDSSQSSTQ